jgi:hypothetical protein
MVFDVLWNYGHAASWRKIAESPKTKRKARPDHLPMTARTATRLRSLCLNVSHITPRRAFAAQAASSTSSASSSQAENAPEVSRPAKQTQWTRPHAPGEVPLYDMAMKIIEEDSARHRSEIVRLQALCEEEPQKENAQLRRDIEKLEVLSEVNVPETRWRFENGCGKDAFRLDSTGSDWKFLAHDDAL